MHSCPINYYLCERCLIYSTSEQLAVQIQLLASSNSLILVAKLTTVILTFGITPAS